MDFQDYSEQVDFQKYWLTLKRNWLPAACVWGATVACATGLALSAKPTYEAEGKLLFKKQSATSALISPSATDSNSKLGELQALGKDNTPLDTEAEVIRSMPVVKKAIAALGWKDETGMPMTPKDFLTRLQVKTVRGTDILAITYQNPDPRQAAAAVNQLMSIYIQENIRANRAEATAAREFISKQLPDKEAAVRRLESRVRDFREANRIVDLEQEAKATVAAISDLDNQLAKAKVQLDTIATKQVEVQRKAGMDSQQAIATNALGQSPGIQRSLQELQKVQEQIATNLARYNEDAPIVQRLRGQEANLQNLLRGRVGAVLGDRLPVPRGNYQIGQFQQDMLGNLVNLEVERLSLESQTLSIARILVAYRERATLLPSLDQRQRDLTRQLNAAQSTYESLLKNLQQVQVAENQNVGNARIVSSATMPDAAVSPNRKVIILGGVLVGGLLYVVTAFLLELRDPSVKTVKEIRGLFAFPVLRLIPLARPVGLLGRLNPLNRSAGLPIVPLRDQPQSMVSEAFRMLQTNLRHSEASQSLKAIAVMSSVSGEGRSTVAANLALALSQLGNRVLLLDTDLRNPMQQRLWMVSPNASLAEVTGDRAKLRQAVQRVGKTLDLLPAGPLTSDPLAVLDSQSMQALMAKLKAAYDYVIIDTPPMLMAADALVMGKWADGVLMVARPGAIDAVSAHAANDLLAQAQLPVLGMVVNAIRPGQEPESYFHHAKGYRNQPPRPPAPPSDRDREPAVDRPGDRPVSSSKPL
jgi:polysaccharide biosynthesis transport protein